MSGEDDERAVREFRASMNLVPIFTAAYHELGARSDGASGSGPPKR